MRVFVAGAAGAIGQQLLPQLVASGHQVTASTRSAARAGRIRELGADPVVADGLDAMAVGEAVAKAEPEVVIHQMTALSGSFDLRRFDRTFAVTNELRTRGTDHLLAAAAAAGARRLIAASYTGWPNVRDGGPVKTEADPLDPSPPAAQRESLAAIRYLEQAVSSATSLEGIVLRYGSFYGPGASDEYVGLVRKRRLPVIGDGAGIWSWLHISDAAAATVRALDHGAPGVYNVVDDEPASVAQWLPHLAGQAGHDHRRRLRAAAAAAVLDRLPHAGHGQRRRGHRAGVVPALPPGRGGGTRRDRLAEGVPVGGDHPAVHRSPAFGAGAAAGIRGRVAARAAADRHRGAGPGGRGGAGRLAVDGVPAAARAAQPGGSGRSGSRSGRPRSTGSPGPCSPTRSAA